MKKTKRIKPKCILSSCRNQGQHRCRRCKAVFYCTQECLSEDWSNHKVYCDYVCKASKDYAFEENHDNAYEGNHDNSTYEGNSAPHDSANEDQEETGNSGTVEG